MLGLGLGIGLGLGLGRSVSNGDASANDLSGSNRGLKPISMYAVKPRTLVAVPETMGDNRSEKFESARPGKTSSESAPTSLMHALRPTSPRVERVSNRRVSARESLSPHSKKNPPVFMTPTPDMTKFSLRTPAGEGKFFKKKDQKSNKVLLESKPDLPDGFLASVYATRTGKQHTDYLPQDDNLNEASHVGTVKPRSKAEDWLETGYDPWSEGKDPTATDFIPTIEAADGVSSTDMVSGGGGTVTAETKMMMRVKEDEEKDKLLDELFSLARHGRYDEIEELILGPDWALDIDEKDKNGNTLLHVSAQNGNKRIAKLALRHGANINEKNLNGNTVLHYCYEYDNEKLAEYLIGKGADDGIVNASGMTCYEGLSMEEIENL
eukprot:g1418.t1